MSSVKIKKIENINIENFKIKEIILTEENEEESDIFLFVGNNGSGKSTFLQMIYNLLSENKSPIGMFKNNLTINNDTKLQPSVGKNKPIMINNFSNFKELSRISSLNLTTLAPPKIASIRKELANQSEIKLKETFLEVVGDSVLLKENKIYIKRGFSEIEDSKLSSGEKQLLYNYTDLLFANENNLTFLLIDEPETSLHPLWQLDYLSNIENLLRDKNLGQIFIATHSPFIIQGITRLQSLRTSFLLVDSEVEILKSFSINFQILKSINHINYKAFGIFNKDFHIELFNKLQIQYNEERIEQLNKILIEKGITTCYPSSPDEKLIGHKSQEESICVYIRNEMHHPGNRIKPKYEDL